MYLCDCHGAVPHHGRTAVPYADISRNHRAMPYADISRPFRAGAFSLFSASIALQIVFVQKIQSGEPKCKPTHKADQRAPPS